MSIEKLLAAQAVDRKRLKLLLSLEKGNVKVELDKAQKTIADSKNTLLQLEAEAKGLQDNFQKLQKILNDTLAQVKRANQKQSEDMGEYGDFLSSLSVVESQLADVERRINEKVNNFKNVTLSVMKASEFIKKTAPIYAKQEKEIMEQVAQLSKEFVEKTKGVDEKLLAKYEAVRKSKKGDVKDVVVPLQENRCYGCYMEVPVAIINAINTAGWGLCEECGRIIYKK